MQQERKLGALMAVEQGSNRLTLFFMFRLFAAGEGGGGIIAYIKVKNLS